jgi:hypothetical protein
VRCEVNFETHPRRFAPTSPVEGEVNIEFRLPPLRGRHASVSERVGGWFRLAATLMHGGVHDLLFRRVFGRQLLDDAALSTD